MTFSYQDAEKTYFRFNGNGSFTMSSRIKCKMLDVFALVWMFDANKNPIAYMNKLISISIWFGLEQSSSHNFHSALNVVKCVAKWSLQASYDGDKKNRSPICDKFHSANQPWNMKNA